MQNTIQKQNIKIHIIKQNKNIPKLFKTKQSKLNKNTKRIQEYRNTKNTQTILKKLPEIMQKY